MFETSLLDTFRYDFKSAAVGNDSTMFLERVNVPLGNLSSYPKLLSGRGLLVISSFIQNTSINYSLVGGLEHVLFSIIHGMSSFPLTVICFRGVGIPPIRIVLLYIVILIY